MPIFTLWLNEFLFYIFHMLPSYIVKIFKTKWANRCLAREILPFINFEMAHKLHLQSVHNHKLSQKYSTLLLQVFKVDDFPFPFLMSSSSIGEGLSAGWKTIERYELRFFFSQKKNNYVKVAEIKSVSCRIFQSCLIVAASAIFNKIVLLKRCCTVMCTKLG